MLQEEYSYWLANLSNIGIKKIEKLLLRFKSSEGVFHASIDELYALKQEGEILGCFSSNDIETIIKNREVKTIKESYARLLQKGICFISKEMATYPDKLRNCYDAPYAIYLRGRIPKKEEKLLAIVGARECTPYGRELARYLSGAVAKEGITVISGLARGIDSYAHEGALSSGGRTYGVLGCGIDNCYPKENFKLYMQMQEYGGIISEYAPGVKPLAGHFPMRNRIISALSDGILVIEAREKSGALITVDYGLEQGKDIYALPGRITDRLSEGCNNLIKMGAKLVASPQDILEDLMPGHRDCLHQANSGSRNLMESEERLYHSLNADPKHIEEITALTNEPMDQLMEQLLSLELKGLIRQVTKNYYCKLPG